MDEVMLVLRGGTWAVFLVVAGAVACSEPAATVDASPPDDIDAAQPGPVRAVAPVTICDPNGGAPFTVASGPESSRSYSCSTACAQQDPLACSIESTVLDGMGRPKRDLFFVTDAMGGTIRYRDAGTQTFVWHPGQWGTDWMGQQLLAALEQASVDLRTVQLRWEPGYVQNPAAPLGMLGWLTRRDGSPTTLGALAIRPASVLAWIHDHFAAQSRFGYGGCSGGALAMFLAGRLYQTRDLTDYQVLLGGPPVGDLGFMCATATGPGWCEDQPDASCTNDDDCAGAANLCMTLTVSPFLAAAAQASMDYVHRSDACSAHRVDPALVSPIDEPDLDWGNDYMMDFELDTGGSFFADGKLGAGGTAAAYFDRLTGPKRWTVQREYLHCASESDPALAAALAARVVEAMR